MMISGRPAGAADSTPPTPTTIARPATEAEPDRQTENDLRKRLAEIEAELQRVTQADIAELATRDREVRAHEQAHLAVGGQYAGAVTYDYERGPDGRLYAVGGSVSIDTAAVPGDPAATLAKAQQVQRAALAPAQPSATDLSVAAQAAQMATQARAELASQSDDDTRARSPDDQPGTDRKMELYRTVGSDERSAESSVNLVA
ncbi:MAG TPA: hypothetical protein ENI17_16295 [Pseudomonas xinjiangensis]|uniref:SprA-related family protein n=2 Tax=root TaxID=1 RepID=A0A7V1BND8_9GAMM|nr:hypothetical protein [Halopseudomonas xinjiangensis]HEC49163.1 hypothetical protein [Halopseudomonas xinjiangensis]